VGTEDVVVFVELREVGRWEGRDKVCLEGGGVEGAADYLLDLTGVEVDTAAEDGHFCFALLRNEVLSVWKGSRGTKAIEMQDNEMLKYFHEADWWGGGDRQAFLSHG
jgi:hypothetical protein